MRFPNGHLARIPHGAVESQRPSLPRNPVYISNNNYLFRLCDFNDQVYSRQTTELTRFLIENIIYFEKFNRCTYQNYRPINMPGFHLENLDLSSRIIQPQIYPPGKLSGRFYIWYETV